MSICPSLEEVIIGWENAHLGKVCKTFSKFGRVLKHLTVKVKLNQQTKSFNHILESDVSIWAEKVVVIANCSFELGDVTMMTDNSGRTSTPGEFRFRCKFDWYEIQRFMLDGPQNFSKMVLRDTRNNHIIEIKQAY